MNKRTAVTAATLIAAAALPSLAQARPAEPMRAIPTPAAIAPPAAAAAPVSGGGGSETFEWGDAGIEDALAGARASGEGRLLLVGGEAGVGKTALLRRFCASQSARVLWGACEPLRTPRPLGPLLDVAEATGGELEALTSRSARPHE